MTVQEFVVGFVVLMNVGAWVMWIAAIGKPISLTSVAISMQFRMR